MTKHLTAKKVLQPIDELIARLTRTSLRRTNAGDIDTAAALLTAAMLLRKFRKHIQVMSNNISV